MSPVDGFEAVLYLLWVIVLMPIMGAWSWYQIRSGKPLPPKDKRYRAMILMQVWIFALTCLIARDYEVDLFGSFSPPLWGWVLAAAYMVLVAHRLKAAWQKISEERKEKGRRLLPESSRELRYWIPISLLAGLSEECAFRGAAFVLLSGLMHSRLLAATVCIASFGIAHMMQGWRGVLGTSIIALIMHGLVFLTGALYLPIAVHVSYDLIVGFIAVRAYSQATTGTVRQAQGAG